MSDKYRYHLSKKLRVPKHKIKYHNLKYYYTKKPELCCRYKLDPISDVQPYQFNKALNILDNYYKDIKSDYYKNLYKESKKYNKNILEQKPDQTLDHIILEYIKFRPNTYIITLWPNVKDKLNELKDLLNKHGNIYYIRKFNLSYNAAKNLIYQMYSDTFRLSTVDKIEEKLEYIGWKKG